MDIFRQIFDWLGNALNQALSNSPIKQYLPAFNYFIDVAFIINTLAAWVTCIAVYYGYQVILRWIKAIN